MLKQKGIINKKFAAKTASNKYSQNYSDFLPETSIELMAETICNTYNEGIL